LRGRAACYRSLRILQIFSWQALDARVEPGRSFMRMLKAKARPELEKT